MILIAYASKSGVAKEAAEILSKLLPSADLVDLAKETPQPESYDAIIVGSGVRIGAISKAARAFLDTHKAILSSKKLAIFIANSFADSTNEVLEASIPRELRESAVWIGSVGGKLDAANLRGLDKVIAKAASKAVKEGQRLHEELNHTALEELASHFR